MLVIAALVPDSALLIPGAAGRAVVCEEARAAALAAVGEALGVGPDRVVVVASGPADRVRTGPCRPSLVAAGIDGELRAWGRPDAAAPPVVDARPGPAVAASTALLLLDRVGWAGLTTVAEVAPPAPAAPPAGAGGPHRSEVDRFEAEHAGDERASALRALGSDLAAGSERVAFVVAGSLSARNGPRAPLPHDDRAAGLDSSVLADLAAPDAGARRRLAAISGSLAAELAMTAWAPLQVLLGAAAGAPALSPGAVHQSAPFGVTYVVALWRAAGDAGAGVGAATAGSARRRATS